MDIEAPTPAGKTAEQILKGKAKVERARLKRIRDREAVKPKAKKAKKTAKKARKVTKTKAKKSAKRPKVMAAVARSERLDLRLSKPEKAKVTAKAQKLRRTVTSIVIEAIEKIK